MDTKTQPATEALPPLFTAASGLTNKVLKEELLRWDTFKSLHPESLIINQVDMHTGIAFAADAKAINSVLPEYPAEEGNMDGKPYTVVTLPWQEVRHYLPKLKEAGHKVGLGQLDKLKDEDMTIFRARAVMGVISEEDLEDLVAMRKSEKAIKSKEKPKAPADIPKPAKAPKQKRDWVSEITGAGVEETAKRLVFVNAETGIFSRLIGNSVGKGRVRKPYIILEDEHDKRHLPPSEHVERNYLVLEREDDIALTDAVFGNPEEKVDARKWWEMFHFLRRMLCFGSYADANEYFLTRVCVDEYPEKTEWAVGHGRLAEALAYLNENGLFDGRG